jgi:WD40 repeat protein
MLRYVLALAAGVALFITIGLSTGLIGVPGILDVARPRVEPPSVAQLGDDLYPAASFPAIDADAFKPKRSPITLHGFAQIKDKQEVPSLVSGQMLFVGDPVPDGAVEAAGVAPFLIEPYGYNTVNVGRNKLYKFYRRLLPNDVVKSDDLVGMVECSKALALIKEKQIKIKASTNDEKSAKAAADEAASRYIRDYRLSLTGGISAAELSASLAAKEKFHYDWKAKSDAVEAAQQELQQAELLYSNHEIRNKLPFRRCVIQLIQRQRGDPVKEQDVVMTIHSLDHLQAEAMVDASYLDRFKPDMTATIEPTQETHPLNPFPGLHRGEVKAIAVTNDVKAPRVVSAGTDRIVNVLDPVNGGVPVRLDHDDVVRALACTPVASDQNLCIAGAGSKIYVWNLDRSALGDGRKVERVGLIEHISASDNDSARVTCLAFSPDGKYFASGADDGSIAIWRTPNLADKDHGAAALVYRLDAEHGVEQGHSDPITALTFTPQCRLVSASSDKTIRIWQLKTKGVMQRRPNPAFDPTQDRGPDNEEFVADAAPIAGRDGNVPQLGVRADGKWFLFDKGNSLQFASLEHPGATITTLQNYGASTPFETLAQFSPDGKLLLTAGLPEGRLQLWLAPTETSRGFEVRQYVPGDKQLPATCAAFFPRHRYIVSGTAGGEVYFWELPTEREIQDFRIKNVPVRLLSSSIDASTRQARIAVDVQNLDGRLRPGRAVTVVIGEE